MIKTIKWIEIWAAFQIPNNVNSPTQRKRDNMSDLEKPTKDGKSEQEHWHVLRQRAERIVERKALHSPENFHTMAITPDKHVALQMQSSSQTPFDVTFSIGKVK